MAVSPVITELGSGYVGVMEARDLKWGLSTMAAASSVLGFCGMRGSQPQSITTIAARQAIERFIQCVLIWNAVPLHP